MLALCLMAAAWCAAPPYPVRVPLAEAWEVSETPAGRASILQAEDLIDTDALVGPWELHPVDTAACGAVLNLVCTPDREDALHLRFHGARIRLYGLRSRWTGQIGWRIDGGERSGVIDAYTPREAVHQDLLLAVDGLPETVHTLTLYTLQTGYEKHSPWWHDWQFWFDYAETDGCFFGPAATDEVLPEPSVTLPDGGAWTTTFRGDRVALRVRLDPGCALRAWIDDVEVAMQPAVGGWRYIGEALDRDAEDLRQVHRIGIEVRGGACRVDALRVERRRPQAAHVHELPVDSPEGMRLAGVLTERVIPAGVAQNARVRMEACGSDGAVLHASDRWFLSTPLGPDEAAVASVRFTLEQGDAPRSPVLREVHLLWTPIDPAADGGPVRIGFSPNAHADARQAVRLGVGDLLWVEKPGMFPVSPWHENPKVDVFRNAALCRREGLGFVVSGRRGLGDFVRPVEVVEGWIQDTTPDIYDAEETAFLADLGGPLFLGYLMEEMDTSMVQGGLRDESMAEFTELYGFTDRRGGRLAYEREIRTYADRYRSWGARALVNCGVTYPFASYRAGADMVVAELQCMMVCNNVQLAYLRGASHQFGRPFGAWVSLWRKATLPCEDPGVLAWKGMRHLGGPDDGYSAGEMRRSLLASVCSGARFAMVQDAVPLFTDFDRDGRWELSRRGEAIRSVHALVRELGAIQPHKGAALLIDKDCGYSPGHLWDGFVSWTHWEYRHGNPLGHVWGKLRPGRPERMLRDMLDVVYPGWDRAGLDVYPGTFADTPHGPVDVIASDIPFDRLSAYDAVVLAGRLDPDPALDAALVRFVETGGSLDVNAAHLTAFPALAQAIGGVLGDPEPRALPDGATAPVYTYAPAADARVVHAVDGAPLAVERRTGSGRIALSLVAYDLTEGPAEEAALTTLARDRLAQTVADANARRIQIDRRPGLEYLSFVYDDGAEGALLMNHGAEPIETEVRWPACAATIAIDLVAGERFALAASADGSRGWTASLAPGAIRMLRLEAEREERR